MSTFKQIIERTNNLLKLFDQHIRINEYSRGSITLSTGQILSGDKFKKIKGYILNKNTTIWIENFDKIINDEISEKDIKHQLAVSRGKKSWALNSETIRKNLNTGIPWSKGKIGLGKGRKHTDETKKKISIKNSGENNGMYGTTMSTSDKKLRSDIMNNLISVGKFTPNSNNRNTHFESSFDNKRYRSSWEALYQYHNQYAEYETLRIQYLLDNKNRVYIVDFIDHINKLVIEVKPKELCVGQKWQAKLKSLFEWATNNGYTVIIADKLWLTSNILFPDLSRFDSNTSKKIGDLYEINKKNRN